MFKNARSEENLLNLEEDNNRHEKDIQMASLADYMENGDFIHNILSHQ